MVKASLLMSLLLFAFVVALAVGFWEMYGADGTNQRDAASPPDPNRPRPTPPDAGA